MSSHDILRAIYAARRISGDSRPQRRAGWARGWPAATSTDTPTGWPTVRPDRC
jgi:hypothetical protein